MRTKRSIYEGFTGELNYILSEAYLETGDEPVEASPADMDARWTLGDDGSTRLAIEWDLPRDQREPVPWRITYAKRGHPKVESGTYPQDKPLHAFAHIRDALSPPAKRAQIRPKGRLVSVLLSATMGLVALVLIRALAISMPTQPVVGAFGHAAATSQQILSHLSFGDLPMVLVGTFVNEPVIGLVALGALSFSLFAITTPVVQFSKDIVTWRAGLLLLTSAASIASAASLVALPWTALILASTVMISGCFVISQRLDQELTKCLHEAHRFDKELRDAGLQEHTSSLMHSEFDEHLSLTALSQHVASCAKQLRTKVRRHRDRALKKRHASHLYRESRIMHRVLVEERRALASGRPVDERRFRRWLRWNPRLWSATRSIAFAAPVWVTIAAVLYLLISPTPWNALECFREGASSTAVATIDHALTYFDTRSRQVITLTDDQISQLAPGACT